MRVPLSWLRELVVWDEAAAVLAERLDLAGLGIVAIEEVGRVEREIRVGRIVATEAHVGADRLQICRLDLGRPAPLVVVSGAPGLAAGQCVPVALPGTRLATGRIVETVELRGVRSEGMLCSESECGLGDEAGSVLVLADDVVPGTPLVELPEVADTVLELEVTPNRGDWLSILGVAREVAALTGATLRRPRLRWREQGAAAAEAVRVRVQAGDLCPRYTARVIRGVTVRPSPLWVRLRLRRAGMRPINAVVDATNYVMLERGQPLHAFDLAGIAAGEIVVRVARAGERLTTLDGVERVLEPADLVIADARGPVALAGVMGGRDSEVTPDTRDVVLESAFFSPASVRRTSRRLGLPSQAAHRFERRVDPQMVPEAATAAAVLMTACAGGRIAPGLVEDAPGLAALAPPTVRLRPARAEAVLGVHVTRGEISRRLRALGASVRAEGRALVVTAPSHRSDLEIEEDVIEEVARLGGYDAVPVVLPSAPMTRGRDSETRLLGRRLRGLLVAEGLCEMVTLSFTDADTNRRLPGFVGAALAPIAVRNPLSSETGELRRSPLAGLARALRLNLAHGAAFVAAFELGKGYGRGPAGERQERRAVSLLLHGTWPPRGAERQGVPVDFLDLKGIVDNLLDGCGVPEPPTWRPTTEFDFLHPGKAALVTAGGASLGAAGLLHPEIAQAIDLPAEVLICELDFTALGHYRPRRSDARPLPRFPAVTRDIAIVVDEAFPAATVLEEVRALQDPRIESVRLFDCYRGDPIPSGRKSLAYTLAYRAAERTLTDDEVSALHDRVRTHLSTRFPIELRS